jgi:hypothetical protein
VRYVLSFLAALPLLTGTAFGWGCEGHQMIALIARAHLTPDASAAVDRLLRESPLDPGLNRFCKDRPDDLMADSATWADDTKNVEKTGAWHFIDIPLSIQDGSEMKWCGAPTAHQPACIVTAIEYELGILSDKSQPPPDRAKALRYVIHLMGDLSQPLHDSDNRDQGGNCTSVQFSGEGRAENLHAVWDHGILSHELAAKHSTQAEYAMMLDRTFARKWVAWGQSKTDVARWAWEGHNLATAVVYGHLRPQIPIEPPVAADRAACDAERGKVTALHISIGRKYTDQALPVIRQQLAKAGYRLAGSLNQTFK